MMSSALREVPQRQDGRGAGPGRLPARQLSNAYCGAIEDAIRDHSGSQC